MKSPTLLVALFCFAFALTLLLAAHALAAAVMPPGAPVLDPGSDPTAFVQQIMAAAGAHQWLMAVPLVAIGLMWGTRKLLAGKMPWLASDQGGAVLALATAACEAVVAASLLPGPHAVAATITWVVVTLLRNKMLFLWLQKAGIDLSVDPKAPADPKPADPAVPPVVKALLLAALVPALLWSSPVAAQEPPPAAEAPAAAAPAAAPVAAPGCAGIQCLTWSMGPTVPIVEVDFKGTHPFQLAPGAGIQFNLGLEQLQVEISGKAWDLLSLQLAVFGSLVSGEGSPTQMGAFSASLGFCTFSGLVCLSVGKHIVVTQGGLLPGADGWFIGMSGGINFGLSPGVPPLGVAQGAAGLPRANYVYLR